MNYKLIAKKLRRAAAFLLREFNPRLDRPFKVTGGYCCHALACVDAGKFNSLDGTTRNFQRGETYGFIASLYLGGAAEAVGYKNPAALLRCVNFAWWGSPYGVNEDYGTPEGIAKKLEARVFALLLAAEIADSGGL